MLQTLYHGLYYLIFAVAICACSQEKRSVPPMKTEKTDSPVNSPTQSKERPKTRALNPTLHVPVSPGTSVNKESAFYRKIQNLVMDTSAPAGVGALYVMPDLDKNDLFRCNSFLIAKNLLITNAHCVESIKAKDCSQHLLIKVKENSGSVIAGCKQIVKYSDYDPNNVEVPDYAVIELMEEVNDSKTYTINREGIKADSKYTIHSLDFKTQDDGVEYAKYNPKSCRALYHVYDLYFHDALGRSKIVNFRPFELEGHCESQNGNSGSLITNVQNEAVAILSSHTTKENTLMIKNNLIAKNQLEKEQGIKSTFDELLFPNEFKEIPIATNFTCIKFGIEALDQSYSNQLCDSFLTKYWDENIKDYKSYSKIQKEEYINYQYHLKVNEVINRKFHSILEQSFPAVKMTFFKVSRESAQKYAKDFDLGLLPKHKTFLVFYPICKQPEFFERNLSDYKLQLPIYQLNFQDKFDEYFVYERTVDFHDPKVHYFFDTNNLKACP